MEVIRITKRIQELFLGIIDNTAVDRGNCRNFADNFIEVVEKLLCSFLEV